MWQSPMWGADAFGGNGTGSDLCVTDGRFANMTLRIGPGDEDTEYCLRRAWDNENAIANANSTMLDMCNSYNTYSPLWDCISNIPHKGVHTLVAQTPVPISLVTESPHEANPVSFRRRLQRVLWDTFAYTPEERQLVFKIDFFILYSCLVVKSLVNADGHRTWASFSYFSKNLNQNNLCMCPSPF
jgi:hypothetical protein